MVVRLHNRLRKTRVFPETLIGVDFYKKGRVLNRTGENPEVSTRRTAMFECVDHTTVFATLQSQRLKLYCLQRVQAFGNVDCEQRRVFCLLFYFLQCWKLSLIHICAVVRRRDEPLRKLSSELSSGALASWPAQVGRVLFSRPFLGCCASLH